MATGGGMPPGRYKRSMSEDVPLKDRMYSTWYRFRYGMSPKPLVHALKLSDCQTDPSILLWLRRLAVSLQRGHGH